jgi:hypothetical protein
VVWSTYVNACKRRYPEQAKDADKLEPKGTVAGRGFVYGPLVNIQRHRRIEQNLTHSGISAKRGKPVSLPQKLGRSAVRRDDGGAGKGMRKKQTPFCNGTDRD